MLAQEFWKVWCLMMRWGVALQFSLELSHALARAA